MRHHADRRHCAFLRFIQICATLILTSVVVTACGSGHGVDSEDNPLAGLFGDLFSSSSGKSIFDKDKSSSSSTGKSSSSVKSSSSIDFFDYSPTNNKYDFSKDSTAVKSVADLGKCENGDRRGVIKDSSYYYCAYETWFKEVGSLPKCTKQNDLTTFYKGVPYMCVSGELKILSEMEAKLGLCTKAKQGKIKESNNFKYICDDLIWTKQSITEVHGKCTIETNGTTVKYGNKDYICRWSSWNEFSELESDSGACTKDRFGELLRIKTSSYYDEYTYYVCKDFDWSKTTDPADIFGACNSKMTDSIYVIKSNSYVCENSEWRKTTSVEDKYGLCNAKMQDSLYKLNSSTYMVCDKRSWRSATVEEVYGKCTAALQDTLYSYDSKTYACNNLKWIVLPDPPSSSLSYCTKKNENTTYKTTSPKAYYICTDYAWTKTDSLTYAYGICDKESLGTRKHPNTDSLGYECKATTSGYSWAKLTINDYDFTCNEANQDSVFKGYLCDNGKLRTLTSLEKSLGICTITNLDKKASKSSSYYRCTSTGWTSISKDEYNLKDCTTETDSNVVKISSGVYICANEEWTKLPDMSKAACNPGVYAVKDDSVLYQCIENTNYYHNYWKQVSSVAYEHGFCNDSRTKDLVLYKGNYYICTESDWQKASIGEIFERSTCGETVTIEDLTFTCTEGVWAPKYGTMTDTRNNKTYRTLTHNNKTMMVDNLNYPTPNSWCFQNIDSNCDKYGRLYPWEDVKTACPKGWHVRAADEEFISRSIIEYYDYDFWQQDVFTQHLYKGLEIKGSGLRYDDGTFEYELRFAGFWTATELETDDDYALVQYYNLYSSTSINNNCSSEGNPITGPCFSKGTGLSIRCVED